MIDALSLLDRPPDLSGCRVLVAGGGDVAIDAASRRAAPWRARGDARLPEPEAAMAAAADAVLLAREEGVTLLPDHAVTAVTPGRRGRIAGRARQGRGVHATGVRLPERLEPAEPWLVDRVIWATGQRLDPVA